MSSILPWAGGSREAGRYAIVLSRDKDRIQMSGSLASAAIAWGCYFPCSERGCKIPWGGGSKYPRESGMGVPYSL